MTESRCPGKGVKGMLYGVGLGPGDPELVTLKAVRVLGESSTIFVPVTRRGGGGRALSILSSLNPEWLEKVVMAEVPMDRGSTDKWRKVVSAVVSKLSEGEVCSFVNEGDPLLYGSFIHVLRALREEAPPGLRVEVVSGLPSFCAAAAGCLIPLASGREKLVIIPGCVDAEEMEGLLEDDSVIIVLKLSMCLEDFLRFVSGNRERIDWWCVENCSLPHERLYREEALLLAENREYFALAVVKRKSAPGRDDAGEAEGGT